MDILITKNTNLNLVPQIIARITNIHTKKNDNRNQ